MTEPNCPKCSCEYTYRDGNFLICPECSHEWSGEAKAPAATAGSEVSLIKDAYGNVLQTGDAVIVVKDLKVKGSSSVVKGGTKVKNIRLVESVDGHNIACKIDGIGAMNLKSEFVKKS